MDFEEYISAFDLELIEEEMAGKIQLDFQPNPICVNCPYSLYEGLDCGIYYEEDKPCGGIIY